MVPSKTQGEREKKEKKPREKTKISGGGGEEEKNYADLPPPSRNDAL